MAESASRAGDAAASFDRQRSRADYSRLEILAVRPGGAGASDGDRASRKGSVPEKATCAGDAAAVFDRQRSRAGIAEEGCRCCPGGADPVTVADPFEPKMSPITPLVLETLPPASISSMPVPDNPMLMPNEPLLVQLEPAPVTVTVPFEAELVPMVLKSLLETLPPASIVSVPVPLSPGEHFERTLCQCGRHRYRVRCC